MGVTQYIGAGHIAKRWIDPNIITLTGLTKNSLYFSLKVSYDKSVNVQKGFIFMTVHLQVKIFARSTQHIRDKNQYLKIFFPNFTSATAE